MEKTKRIAYEEDVKGLLTYLEKFVENCKRNGII